MPESESLLRLAGLLVFGGAMYGLGRLARRSSDTRRSAEAYERGIAHGSDRARAAFVAVLEGRQAISRAYAKHDLERLPAHGPVEGVQP